EAKVVGGVVGFMVLGVLLAGRRVRHDTAPPASPAEPKSPQPPVPAHKPRVLVTSRSLVLLAVASALTVPWVSRAQQAPPPRVRREIRGFDFRKDGVWRRQARAVRALRARLLSRRNFGALNAPMAAAGAALASGAAVSGVL